MTLRSVGLVLGLLCLGAQPAVAQAPSPQNPSQTAPAEKIDPNPIGPDAPAPDAEPPAAEDQAADAASDPLGVPANIFAVRVAGPWSAGEQRGFTRVVGVIDGERQRFYVQWLSEPDGHVVETKELEDEEAAKLTFGDVRAEQEETGVTVFLDTVPDKDGMRDTWVLIIGAPGEMRFGPATN